MRIEKDGEGSEETADGLKTKNEFGVLVPTYNPKTGETTFERSDRYFTTDPDAILTYNPHTGAIRDIPEDFPYKYKTT